MLRARLYVVLTVTAVLFSSALRAQEECVVLLHGLARTAGSMTPIAVRLEHNGYVVVNSGYPSRDYPIERLAAVYVERSLGQCRQFGAQRIHFVTHSLGGILVRQYLSQTSIHELGYTVMLAPPNQGSEVVDTWGNVPGYKLLNGVAGDQLGKGVESVPLKLGPVDFPVGIIAGTRTINPFLSLSIPNPDDGKVSVESTKVEGMTDHVEVAHSHTFIMRSKRVHEHILHFLEHGVFLPDDA